MSEMNLHDRTTPDLLKKIVQNPTRLQREKVIMMGLVRCGHRSVFLVVYRERLKLLR